MFTENTRTKRNELLKMQSRLEEVQICYVSDIYLSRLTIEQHEVFNA